MKQTTEKNKNMKNLMEAPVFKLQELWFESIDDSADCVGNTAKNQINHASCSKCWCEFAGEKDDEPTHGNINRR